MHYTIKPVLGVVAATCLALVACGSDPNANGLDGDGSSGSSGSSGASGGFGEPGSSGGPGEKECAAQEAQATLTKRPVDVIFVIDNSGSMSQEITEVQNQVTTNFTNIIEAAQVDYRVILVSRHGPANGDQSICISQPLSGGSCNPIPAQPQQTAKFFHYSVEVASTDAWCKLMTRFNTADAPSQGYNLHPNGWGERLRPDSFKVIVGISDDRISGSCTVNGSNISFNDNSIANATANAEAFDTALLALSPQHFGTAAKRNYVYHAISGFAFRSDNAALAYTPDMPINEGQCGGDSANISRGHQAMAKLTGGLRYPSCNPNYTTIFQAIAEGVVAGAQVACEFDIPEPPSGQKLDLATVISRYTPGGGGAPVDFGQVANVGACAPGKFYIEEEKIKLCPEACTIVQADPEAKMNILFGCALKGAS